MYISDGASHLKVHEAVAVVRNTDNVVLGTVGKKYTPLQNSEAFNFFDPLVEQGVAAYETAGSLSGGKKVWILAKLGGDIVIGDKDPVDRYVLLSNSHDGSSSVTVKTTGVRVVCQNTLSAALSFRGKAGVSEFKVRHTKNVKDRTESALNLLKAVSERFDKLAVVWKAMAEFEMPALAQLDYIQRIIPDTAANTKRAEAKRMEIAQHMTFGAGQELDSARNTLWGTYNGMTHYLTHAISTRKDSTPDKHLDSLWYGKRAADNDDAFQAALDILKESGVSLDI
jgi:phage/plasmid-like protein (TIGR03299 family)